MVVRDDDGEGVSADLKNDALNLRRIEADAEVEVADLTADSMSRCQRPSTRIRSHRDLPTTQAFHLGDGRDGLVERADRPRRRDREGSSPPRSTAPFDPYDRTTAHRSLARNSLDLMRKVSTAIDGPSSRLA